MEAPVAPKQPSNPIEDEDLITLAMAIATVQIKKELKDKVLIKTCMSGWRQCSGEITITLKSNADMWAAYNAALEKYRDELIDFEAEKLGTTREDYLEAKRKLEEYNRKKCEKAPEKDIRDFITILSIDDEIIEAS